MKKIIFPLLLPILLLPALSLGAEPKESAVKDELKNHFQFYGFVRNFFAFDTRESVAGTGDLFYYLPKDVNMNEDGSQDLNARPSFRFLALTTRLGVDVTGYRVGRMSLGAKVETDFYAGLTGSPKINGTAQLRLRQAYMTIGWNDLKLGEENSAAVDLKIGQAWHPMAADQPHVLALETGTPFNPFSRTPLVLMDASLGKHFVLSAGAIRGDFQNRRLFSQGRTQHIEYQTAHCRYRTIFGFFLRRHVRQDGKGFRQDYDFFPVSVSPV